MTVGRLTRVLRKVFFTAVGLMCQVLAGRDAPTYPASRAGWCPPSGGLPVGGDEDAESHTIAVDAADGRRYRVTAGPGLDLPPGQPVTLDVSAADGGIACLRAGAVRPVLLIVTSLLAPGAVYFGAVRLNVHPPVATWLALALGALLAPVAVFVRV